MYTKEILVDATASTLIEPTMETLRKPNHEASVGESRAATEFNSKLEKWLQDRLNLTSSVGCVSNGLKTLKSVVESTGNYRITLGLVPEEENKG
jgi:hypothetical protein